MTKIIFIKRRVKMSSLTVIPIIQLGIYWPKVYYSQLVFFKTLLRFKFWKCQSVKTSFCCSSLFIALVLVAKSSK